MYVRSCGFQERHDHGTDEAEFQESGSFAHGEGGRSASDTTIDPNQSRVLSALSNLIHHPKEPPSSSQSNGQERLVHGSSFEVRSTFSIVADHYDHLEMRSDVRFRCDARTMGTGRCDKVPNTIEGLSQNANQGAMQGCLLRCHRSVSCPSSVSSNVLSLSGSDLISFPKKQTHVAQMIQLPDDPYKRTPEETAAIAAYGLPTLIVVNMQLPVYQVYLTHDLTLLQVAYGL